MFSAVQDQREEKKYYEDVHQDNYKIQYDTQEPLPYISSSGPDTIYFDQAVKHPDHNEFLNVAIRYVNSRFQLNHWKLLPGEEVTKGQPILDSVWEMKKKWSIVTRQVYKWKVILNIH